MRRPSILLGLILLGLFLVQAIAWACGDKVSLGMDSSRIKSAHAAALLVYRGQSASAALIRSLQSQPAFKKGGYQFQVVEDSAELDKALRAGKYDVVVADVSDANGLSQEVSAAASKPVLLPVTFNSSRQEQSEAKKKYHCLLKAPGKTDDYLDAIDDAMDLKPKGGTR